MRQVIIGNGAAGISAIKAIMDNLVQPNTIQDRE